MLFNWKPPKIFYGWWIVAASVIIAMYAGGAVFYGFTAIFEPIANEMGWIVTEVGRQPWIVYKLMRTSDAVSPIATSQVATSLVAFVLVYGLLGAIAFYLMFLYARKGPDPEPAAGK